MFITLEGPEGCGKTSQMPELAEYLRSQGCMVFTTREPGGTAIGDQIRQVLTSLKNTGMNARAETLLFCAARAQLVEQELRPRLKNGEIVLCDRYAGSTLAYQGYGHGNDLSALRSLLQFATGGLWPDLTLLMDLPPEVGLKRKRSCGEWNRLDAYELDFHQRVRQGYLELLKQEPQRFVRVDATETPPMVQLALRQAIMARLQQN